MLTKLDSSDINKQIKTVYGLCGIKIWQIYGGPIAVSGLPRQPAEKARCCWLRRSRTAPGLCGCRWCYATRWIHRMLLPSCCGPRTRWAGRPTRGWWAPRCWPRPTLTIGCCWWMMRGNWWEDGGGGDKWRLLISWSRIGRLRAKAVSLFSLNFKTCWSYCIFIRVFLSYWMSI